MRSFSKEAKIAGPQKRSELVPSICFVQSIEQFKSGVAAIGRNAFFELKLSIIEKILNKSNGLNMCRSELVHFHCILVKVTRMEKLQTEREFFLQPKGFVMPELDVSVTIIVQFVSSQNFRKVQFRGMKWLVGTLLSFFLNEIKSDLRWSRLAKKGTVN